MKLTILVPLAGNRTFKMEKGSAFPKILNELNGKLLLERAASPLLDIDATLEVVVVVPKEHIKQYNLDKVLTAVDPRVKVVPIEGETLGATCTALLAIDAVDQNSAIIVTSFEQILDIKLDPVIKHFVRESADCGLLTFDSIHPRFSYVVTDKNQNVLQAAEKKPISREALAGLYFFKSAKEFFNSAKETIINGSANSGYYISNTINEYVLSGKCVKSHAIPKERYFHFYDSHNVEQYETSVNGQMLNVSLMSLSRTYIKAFNDKDIEIISSLLSNEFTLSDPSVTLHGKNDVLEYISGIFDSSEVFSFEERNVFVDGKYSIIEFELKINNTVLIGTDVISWGNQDKMLSMKAYLYEVKNES